MFGELLAVFQALPFSCLLNHLEIQTEITFSTNCSVFCMMMLLLSLELTRQYDIKQGIQHLIITAFAGNKYVFNKLTGCCIQVEVKQGAIS